MYSSISYDYHLFDVISQVKKYKYTTNMASMLLLIVLKIVVAMDDEKILEIFNDVEAATGKLIEQTDAIFHSVDCMRRLSQSAKQVFKCTRPAKFEFRKNPWVVQQIPETIDYYYNSLKYLEDNLSLFQAFIELSGMNREMTIDTSYTEKIKEHIANKQSITDFLMEKYHEKQVNNVFIEKSRLITNNISKAMLYIKQLYYCVENGNIIDVCFIKREIFRHQCDGCKESTKHNSKGMPVQL
ncbi:hypothetical protein VCUG_00826 [Vavraia culicis subsp. floridensis]|uniref:Uncharacterized protein n=1 Tax=Vavraia culicis (isolate floridensis) TaxID=948595 RepID=L2GVT0_VAVCU|nr:uncharacterized protein VCUG_00826 [Vavraia culicis subsp. floridensis]ELA47744.1 hypothetical protein VCUG_00826 [Vavraia culicis subsp. floridensis]